MMTTMCICNRTLYSHNQCDNDGQGWCRNKIKTNIAIEHQVSIACRPLKDTKRELNTDSEKAIKEWNEIHKMIKEKGMNIHKQYAGIYDKVPIETTAEHQIQQPDTVWHTDEQGNIYHTPIKEENNGTGE